ncbi:hypothetical protein F511_47055 [Dorcoceras hygrometricum]|uniref:Uncharacterized protein n=1 Tax=Dorcoceras hygrometricum TaxID=472368 RepID=A0A2Z6ZZA5_9LAMI|nr:hypothetical protein F511_47055 [Dorcoceras hygrometricum]
MVAHGRRAPLDSQRASTGRTWRGDARLVGRTTGRVQRNGCADAWAALLPPLHKRLLRIDAGRTPGSRPLAAPGRTTRKHAGRTFLVRCLCWSTLRAASCAAVRKFSLAAVGRRRSGKFPAMS